MSRLIFEIGTEELPVSACTGGIEQLKTLAAKSLTEARINFTEICAFATPRRLVLEIRGLEKQQQNARMEIKGPPYQQAYTTDHKPTPAALGFARSRGVSAEQLEVRELKEGKFVFAVIDTQGKETIELLPQILTDLVRSLSFTRTMRLDHDMRFPRPIRWLLCLLDSDVVPLQIEMVPSGRYTYGHRFLSPGKVEVLSADTYFETLDKNRVIVDQDKRRENILSQAKALADSQKGKAIYTPALLEEVTYLVEYPTLLLGHFPKEYLEIPKEVLITVMQGHQRYFPLQNDQENLLNGFLSISNGNPRSLDIIREGNEKVLRARLADAKFFYDEDKKHLLPDNVEKLSGITYQEQLGTLYDKVQRIQQLSGALAEQLFLDEKLQEKIARTSYLAKGDLVSQMVMEFPELQGVMGREYAKLQGEAKEIYEGIYEHYLPRSSGDSIPAHPIGRVISIADKLDTVVSCFGVGLIPTGSADPYGLRRNSMGILSVIIDSPLKLDLNIAMESCLEILKSTKKLPKSVKNTRLAVSDYFIQRFKNLLLDRGIRYDVADAIISVANPLSNLVERYQAAQLLNKFVEKPGFERFYQAMNRVARIASNGKPAKINEKLFAVPAENHLYDAWQTVEDQTQKLFREGKLAEVLEAYSTLSTPIEQFFSEVMVMDENVKVRTNRLALMREMSEHFKEFADFTRIVPAAKG